MRLCYLRAMSLSRQDLVALLVVLGAGIASLVVWDYGRVDIGMKLRTDTDRVVVQDVTPDGNAARSGFSPGYSLLDLTTVDGGNVERGEPIGRSFDGYAAPVDVMPWEYLGPISGELQVYDRDHRAPIEAIDSARIASAVAGEVDLEAGGIYAFASIDRSYLEFLLHQSIWLMALGIGVGVAAWRLLAHGIAGALGRERAILLGAAAAIPFLLLPAVQVGTPIGIYAGYLVPAVLALLLGLSFARVHPDRAWSRTAMAAALVAAGLVAIFAVRFMTSPALEPNDRGGILALVAAIAVVPALILAASQPSVLERSGTVSLALVPSAALMLIGPSAFEPIPAVLLLTALLAWPILPVERGFAGAGAAFRHLRPSSMGAPGAVPAVAAWRDRLTQALFGVIVLAAVGAGGSPFMIIVGVGLFALVGFAVRGGFLGADWIEAATPLAASVGIPVVVLGFVAWDYGGAMGWAGLAAGLGGLSVAHVLAWRHTDPSWRDRLFFGSLGLVVLVALLGGMNERIAIILAGFVPLIPGIPAAFAEEPGEARALTSRLETLAVTLTPGAAATVMFAETNGIVLGAWLVAVVVWRQFTLTPLLGMAQRTQLQRDVAVAAAETERARLAADLHDDALQQLTMLVRTLDESGQTDAAAEAREVATKLRSIVGDLRLPILDDLGAGAALEWLVERVEPLAGGPVKLERSDASRPPANVELAVFRVAQEALTNAIKHGATPIAVRYDVNADGRVTLAIDDAGPGIAAKAAEDAPHEGHFGLLNMQQRAEQIGALLDVRRWPAGGTRVALEWRPQ